MTSRELLYVKTVAEEKSISKAAEKLFVAQPSLSQALMRLEEDLGTVLFNRTPKGLTLTYAGEKYYQTACQILKIYDAFEVEMSDINDLRTGKIHMGITNHVGTLLLPRILNEFYENCPNMELYVSEETTERLDAGILSGEFDFAVFHVPHNNDEHPMISYERLSNEPFVIALQAGHPVLKKAQPKEGYPYPVLDPKDLKSEPFIMLHSVHQIRRITNAILSRSRVTPKIRLTLHNYETALRLSAQGIGVFMVPYDYSNISSIEPPPAFCSIDKKYDPGWDLCIASLKRTYLSRADQYLLSLVRTTLRDHSL